MAEMKGKTNKSPPTLLFCCLDPGKTYRIPGTLIRGEKCRMCGNYTSSLGGGRFSVGQYSTIVYRIRMFLDLPYPIRIKWH